MDKTMFKDLFKPVIAMDKTDVEQFRENLDKLAKTITKQKAVIDRMKELN